MYIYSISLCYIWDMSAYLACLASGKHFFISFFFWGLGGNLGSLHHSANSFPKQCLWAAGILWGGSALCMWDRLWHPCVSRGLSCFPAIWGAALCYGLFGGLSFVLPLHWACAAFCIQVRLHVQCCFLDSGHACPVLGQDTLHPPSLFVWSVERWWCGKGGGGRSTINRCLFYVCDMCMSIYQIFYW